MWNFSSKHIQHIPDKGWKVLALARIFKLVVQLCPRSLRCQMCKDSLVPGWWRVTAVALVLGDPVSDLALGEANVGLLLTSVGVGHLRRVHHPFCHPVARYWALAPPSMSLASSCQLLLTPRQLGKQESRRFTNFWPMLPKTH